MAGIGRDDQTTEVEPTPEMIEAGFQVLAASGIADEYSEVDKLLVAEIYRAMRETRLQQDALQERHGTY